MFVFVSGGGIHVAPRKISAKELVADIKAKMSDNDLMAKYGLSAPGLQKLFQQLLDKRLVNKSDLSGRPPKHPREEEITLSVNKPDEQRVTSSLPPPKVDTPVSIGDTRGEKKSEWFLSKCKVILGFLGLALHSILELLGRLFKKKSSDTEGPSQPEPVLKPTASDMSRDAVQAGEGAGDRGREAASQPISVLGFFKKIKAVPSALAGFFVSLLTGQFLLKLVGYLVVLGLFVLSVAIIAQRQELSLLREAKALVRVDPLQKAEKLYQSGEICDALEHLEYFMDFDYVKENQEVKKFYDKIKAERDSWLFRTKQVGTGIWKGKGACPEAIYSATVSDLVGVGSVRTLAEWGIDKYHGEKTDDFAAMLAAVDALVTSISIASVGATIFSGGTAVPVTGPAIATAGTVKTTITPIKIAKNIGKLPAPVQLGLYQALKKTYSTKELGHFRDIAKSISRIKDVPGLKGRDFFTILSHTKDVKDLERMSIIATTFGTKTGKFLTLGKEKSLQIYDKFHGDPHLVPGLNQAVQYGDKGTNVLMKLGPQKFLKIVAPNQVAMTARTLRSVWEGHLTAVLLHMMKLIPQWVIFSIAAVSGLVVVGIPSMGVYRAWRWLRTPA
jgi:hypothetical protein